MRPPFRTTVAARARRASRIALPTTVAGCLVAGALTVTGGASAAQAGPVAGSFAIGAAPVALMQPVDPGMAALTPAPDAATNGMFGPQVDWPLIPLHSALARNGHLISYGTPLDTAQQGGLAYDDWNPASGFDRSAHVDSASMHDYNSFCNALVGLDDGRLLMVGGNSTVGTMTYDPATGAQDMGADLNRQRWYVTTLRLTDGRILALGGGNAYNALIYQNPGNTDTIAMTPEIGTGTGPWTSLTGATSAYAFGAPDNHWWYPRAFNGPDGTVVGFSGENIWSLTTAGTGAVKETGTLPFNPRVSGSQVMYTPGKVLVAGGGEAATEDTYNAATAAAAVVDFSGGGVKVDPIAPMHAPRHWLNLTVLPNGEVLANGGTRIGIEGGEDNSVKQAEIWNPATGAWRTTATAQRTRTYHSVSLVLPSGAVFTGGGGVPGPENNLNAELYYPSYLFAKNAQGGVEWASRPAIATVSGSATYGGTLALGMGDGRRITGASLISLAAVTHAQNTDQRRIPLAVAQQGSTVTATLPASMNTMPAGDYELTVQDADGVPSPAQIITIKRDGTPGLVTVATGGTIVDPANLPADTAPEPPTAAPAPGAPTAATAPLTIDRSVGIESTSAGTRIAHSGTTTSFKKVGASSPTAAKKASSFSVRPGLASAGGYSLESVDEPGYYLTAPSKGTGTVALVKNDRTKKLAARATFTAVPTASGATALQVWKQRGLYLERKGSTVVTRTVASGPRTAGTFTIRAGLVTAPSVPTTTGRAVGLVSAAQPGLRVAHDGTKLALRSTAKTVSTTLAGQTTWIVRTGLASRKGLSFESRDRPGWFLVAPKGGSGTPTLAKRSGSHSFETRATFTKVTGAGGKNAALRSWAHSSKYLQTKGTGLVVKGLASTTAGRTAGTFKVRSGLSPAPTR